MPETKLDEWHFEFGLCGPDGNTIAESDCEQLLDVIIDWAEQHGYYIGGGSGHSSLSTISHSAIIQFVLTRSKRD